MEEPRTLTAAPEIRHYPAIIRFLGLRSHGTRTGCV